MSTSLYFTHDEFGGLFPKASTLNDAIQIMHFVFVATRKSSCNFSASVAIGDPENGWIIEKSEDGFMFMLACQKPFNGFEVRPGFWAYKEGDDETPCIWTGGGEGTLRPKRLFLSLETAERLMRQLYRDGPESFHFDPGNWENTDDCYIDSEDLDDETKEAIYGPEWWKAY